MKIQILTLGFSPCPNDCFIFHAMLHGKIDTEGLKFKPVIKDVEALNKKAFQNKLDISKLSFFTFAQVQKKYSLLDSGSALGFGVGPLVVSKHFFSPLSLRRGAGGEVRIAIPGKNTTANLLFTLAYPHLKNKTEILFSEIENAVLNGKFDLGLIIHESRFTYKQKGLKKVIDLGEWWENYNSKVKSQKTKGTATITKSLQLPNYPLPLGGIVIKKTFPKEIQDKVNRIIRRSVEFAFANPDSSKSFVKKHSQEMDDKVIKQHINLYVNKFSISLGKKGKEAVKYFLKEATSLNDSIPAQ